MQMKMSAGKLEMCSWLQSQDCLFLTDLSVQHISPLTRDIYCMRIFPRTAKHLQLATPCTCSVDGWLKC